LSGINISAGVQSCHWPQRAVGVLVPAAKTGEVKRIVLNIPTSRLTASREKKPAFHPKSFQFALLFLSAIFSLHLLWHIEPEKYPSERNILFRAKNRAPTLNPFMQAIIIACTIIALYHKKKQWTSPISSALPNTFMGGFLNQA
jgi:hypothetical protein